MPETRKTYKKNRGNIYKKKIEETFVLDKIKIIVYNYGQMDFS